MSHDVGFYDENEKVICYYFGYTGGIMYDAFNAQHCNAGVSGSNEGVTRIRHEVMKGLKFIMDSGRESDQINKVLKSLSDHLREKPDGSIFIHYS